MPASWGNVNITITTELLGQLKQGKKLVVNSINEYTTVIVVGDRASCEEEVWL